jgi:PadR family transcriptional regulator, regulatory protein PadR
MIRVLQALDAEPTRWRYGYDLGQEVQLRSGSLYPILVRLADRGLLEATWEPGPQGKPPRHLYRLTAAGAKLVEHVTEQAAQPAAPRPRTQVREA